MGENRRKQGIEYIYIYILLYSPPLCPVGTATVLTPMRQVQVVNIKQTLGS